MNRNAPDFPANGHFFQSLSLPVLPPASDFFFAWDTAQSWNADPLMAGADFGSPTGLPRVPFPPSGDERSSQGHDAGAGAAAFLPPGQSGGTRDDSPSPVPPTGQGGNALFAVLQVLTPDRILLGDGGATIQNVGASCESITNGALTINVQTNTSSSPITTPTLTSGQVYTLVAYADAQIGNAVQKRGDSEFYWDNSDPSTYYQGTDVGIRFVSPPPGFTSWGNAYRSDHVYRARITGRGTTESVYYLDANNSDNSGTVRMDIYQGDCLAPDIPPD